MQAPPDQAHRDAVRAAVREIIVSIKEPEAGAEDFADDAPLFDDGSGVPSPVELDSLDGLDLALSIGDRFGFEGDRFDDLLKGDFDLESLRTVNDIVDLVISLSRPEEEQPAGRSHFESQS